MCRPMILTVTINL